MSKASNNSKNPNIKTSISKDNTMSEGDRIAGCPHDRVPPGIPPGFEYSPEFAPPGFAPAGIPEWRSKMNQNIIRPVGTDISETRRSFTWNPPTRRKIARLRNKHRASYIPRDDSSSDSEGASEVGVHTNQTTVTQRVRDIDWTKVKPLRAGIIVYTRSKDSCGNIQFCMGVDADYGEITDFGGGVSYRRDKTTLSGALREFAEESHSIFGKPKPEDLQDCFALYNSKMMIIFLPLRVDHQKIRTDFFVRLSPRSELCDILWVGPEQLNQLCRGEKLISEDGLRKRGLYKRVQDLLKNIDLVTLLS